MSEASIASMVVSMDTKVVNWRASYVVAGTRSLIHESTVKRWPERELST
jgi:hypothetical protein